MPLPRRVVEIETLAELDRLLADGPASLNGWRLQDLDLRGRGGRLNELDAAGSLFLGCRLDPLVAERLRARGALVFPSVPDVPFDAYRSRLYTPAELYDGLDRGYDATLDGRVLAWTTAHHPDDLQAVLARTLHDLAVDDALEEHVAGLDVVGVMGGHAAARGTPAYRDAALLGRTLAGAGLTVATGGGPGAMEAANLGGSLGDARDAVLEGALDALAAVPDYRPSVEDWARSGLAVRERLPSTRRSLGVPTWFYGHEPPNVFADDVAKYFANAVREDVLLHVCRAGVVFLPGRAGTVQEVFQDACENYYADAGSVAPMVLVGVDFWTRELPVWPLLQSLARDRDMEPLVRLVDDVDDAVPALSRPSGGRRASRVSDSTA